MDKEKENEHSVESDNSVEEVSDEASSDASGLDEYQPKEFIEPLKEVQDESVETETDNDSGDSAENEADIQATDLDSSEAFQIESVEDSPESEESRFDLVQTLPENDDSTADAVRHEGDSSEAADPKLESDAETSEPETDNSVESAEPDAGVNSEADELESANPEEKQPSDERAREADQKDPESTSSIQNTTDDTGSTAEAGAEKRKNIYKLAFSVFVIIAVACVLLAYGNTWPFRSKQAALPPAVENRIPILKESPRKIDKIQKLDLYKNYRAILKEVTELRKTLLLKQQEVKGLKERYAKGINSLENDVLQELLSKKIQNYQNALQNTRIKLGLRTIQRRRAYIRKLDEPIKWLEQGSEELLYLRRKALFDLQIIDIAGGIDMDRHMRHIHAAMQKYRLTADNLAIEPDGANAQPLEQVWNKLLDRTKNNPHLQTQLDAWYIQLEVCNGNLSRLGELSDISIDTAKCVSENKGTDIFLNNIATLSPQIAQYLCRWNGKWMSLNGLQTLSPATAQFLFRWKGEWISLNGLTEFPNDMAKHLTLWDGKQLELMGLKFDKNKTDRIALSYLAEWEKKGGKLYVPKQIRDMLKKL
jgi:hypothetical protein